MENSGQSFIGDNRFDPNIATRLLLDIAHEQSVESLFRMLIRHVMEHSGVASMQIWLVDKGDRCASCPQRSRCPDQTQCLHLIAGAGKLFSNEVPCLDDPNTRWPVGVGLVGTVAATGLQLILRGADKVQAMSPEAAWLNAERIQGFSGSPIMFKGKVLGATSILVRDKVPDETLPWNQIFADHIGAAVASARAFEEIHRLKAQLELQNTYLQEEVVEAKAFGGLIGQSGALRQIVSQIDLVAPTEASVLILGGTGTGKELVAHEIHRRSQRRHQPLVRVNCASIPKDLFESEFFGHAKGAFTGAIRDRAGRFEAAEGGTLFLDEIGDVPLEMQSKLLRVLQEKQYERVGEDRTRRADVRIIAATNRDLKQAVAAGGFREDLFYRLCVFPIHVAPLKERKDDIPLLVNHFVELSVKELKCAKPRLTRAAVTRLQNYDWPGNIRELRNVVERAVILARGGPLCFDLPVIGTASLPHASKATSPAGKMTKEILTETEMQALERENLLAALEKTGWKIKGATGAAELVGLKPTTFLARMKKMGLVRPK
ncbi:MAG: sigma 54-interacting transcriptional regulator [Verrucomicrobiae bacterium]|nr:sigma 54-interacting transcriptional regulator [Verrucomicrobiae bacterium]